MTVKKSFLIILRIVFVLSSLQFLRNVFYKWDGYSYYMRFIDFLPHLSLSFILWTVFGLIVGFVLWLIIYGFFKIILVSKISFRFEHIMLWLFFVVLILFIKTTFFGNITLNDLNGLNNFTFLILGGVLSLAVVWLLRKNTEKILHEFDTRITPLTWLFVILLVLSVPLSLLLKKETSGTDISDNSVHVISPYKKRFNIILVIMDALTARDMQMYGYARPTTPFISQWAKDAIVFNKAYSSSNWTTPATMSLMTAQRSWTHGLWYYASYSPVVKEYTNNLPNILANYGYNVYGFVQNEFAHPDFLGIGKSFLTKDNALTFGRTFSNKGLKYTLKKIYIDKPIVRDFIYMNPFFEIRDTIIKLSQRIKSFKNSDYVELTSTPPDIVYNRFLSYASVSTQMTEKEKIKVQLKEPFFVWLHTYPPHSPYLPPKPYIGTFGDAQKKVTALRTGGTLGPYKPEEQIKVDILRKRYDEFIMYCDEQFRSFINRLSDKIDMSNTIIILSSDHGESFSHGYQGHDANHLYEPFVHIPLIMKLPSHHKGRIIDIPIEQIDISPTILELAEIRVPEWMEGRSLVPLIEGEPVKPYPVFSMYLQKNRSFGHPITKGTIAVWDRDYKLIYYLEDKKMMLFNLRTDPDETHNIIEDEPEIAQRLEKLIIDNLSLANQKITQNHQK